MKVKYLKYLYIINYSNILYLNILNWGLGMGDWGLGIGDWGLGPIPNPPTPIPKPPTPNPLFK